MPVRSGKRHSFAIAGTLCSVLIGWRVDWGSGRGE